MTIPSNDVLALMQEHASIRHYLADPVPVAHIEAIVQSAQRASTSSNLQAWSVVCVTEPAKRERLAHLCGDQAHVAQAPVFLAWCADLARLDRTCELRGYRQNTAYLESFLVATIDAVIAAQNAAVAAESLGLGICYIGAIRNNPGGIIELLGLPTLTFPVTGMTVGWPATESIRRPRLAREAVLHWEQYGTAHQDDLLRDYDAAMIATGIYQGRQVPVPHSSGIMENYGWLEHTARRVSQPARTGLRSEVERQGFGLD